MNLPAKKIVGRLLTHPQNGGTAVVIPESPPAEAAPLFLRFALVLQGVEWPLLPAFVLDDWGRERRKLSQLTWIYENGDFFPRAEIFGYVKKPQEGWVETQEFVRDLELMSRWPVFAYANKTDPPDSGIRIRYMGLENEKGTEMVKTKRPERFAMPFTRASLQWFDVPRGINNDAFWQSLSKIL